MQGDGNPELGRRAHEGKLEIGAETDGHIGHGEFAASERVDQAVLLAREPRESPGERPGPTAIESGHMDRVEGESRLGHERPLEPTGLAEEMDLVAARAKLVGQGESRVHMTRGAAGGDRDDEMALIGHIDPFPGHSYPCRCDRRPIDAGGRFP